MLQSLAIIFVFLPIIVLSQNNPCLLGRDRGDNSCGGEAGTRFYYDKGTKHCQPFYYQGCNGNENRFSSLAECREKCSNVTASGSSSGHSMVLAVQTACSINYDAGKFAFQGSHTPRYFYSKSANNCLLFTYYGALGNANNFETYNDCANFCKA
uniref:BPTI/Kunitz inhibitor domain-containing protein n=1 Tax=Panagrolaimus sp. ES5 TaxID=591445 RepID=A0AC34GVU3_9BILA